MKQKTVFTCQECGAEFAKWMGKCANCGNWDTLVESQVFKAETALSKQLLSQDNKVKSLADFSAETLKRLSSGSDEFDFVLSGGFVDGQVVLFTGEPGIGKSTILLQILAHLQQQGKSTLYVSGEESYNQVAGRAQRIISKPIDISFTGNVALHSLLSEIESRAPDFIVIDSIQTMYDEELGTVPGSITQIKSCTTNLVRLAKDKGINLIIVGHITKSGNIAGPKVLEHLVDTVLHLEGERNTDLRLLRAIKHRFGQTNEVGLFKMVESGLQDVSVDDELFAGGIEESVGSVKTIASEGNRNIIVEVQALTNATVFAYPKRIAEGVSTSRLQLICAILDRFMNAQLGDKDVYVRTTGNYKLTDTVSDLAIAVAIMSSVKGKPIAGKEIFVGELGLNGKIALPKAVQARFVSKAKGSAAKLWNINSADIFGKVSDLGKLFLK